jgi:hypothetical protein
MRSLFLGGEICGLKQVKNILNTISIGFMMQHVILLLLKLDGSAKIQKNDYLPVI